MRLKGLLAHIPRAWFFILSCSSLPHPDLPYPHGVPPLSVLALSPLPPSPFSQRAEEVAVPGVSL